MVRFVKFRVLALALTLAGCSAGDSKNPSTSDAGEDAAEGSGGTVGGSETSGGMDTGSDDGEPECESVDPGANGGSNYPCEDPVEILEHGTNRPTGFVRCASGFVHRVQAVACSLPEGGDAPECVGMCGGCDAKPNGVCATNYHAESPGGCECYYPCETDCDCDDGRMCACSGVYEGNSSVAISGCVPATCRADVECEAGLCGYFSKEDCWGGYAQSAACALDEGCHFDDDCAPGMCPGEMDSEPFICAPMGANFECREPLNCGAC